MDTIYLEGYLPCLVREKNLFFTLKHIGGPNQKQLRRSAYDDYQNIALKVVKIGPGRTESAMYIINPDVHPSRPQPI